MREIRVKAPADEGARVAELAFSLDGVARVGVAQEYVHGPGVTNDVVSVETSTPVAKCLVDALLAAPFFEPGTYSLSVRELRAIVTRGDERDRTCAVPETDVAHDLFCHATAGQVFLYWSLSNLPTTVTLTCDDTWQCGGARSNVCLEPGGGKTRAADFFTVGQDVLTSSGALDGTPGATADEFDIAARGW